MVSNRFVTAVIVFNAIMGLLITLSSEGILLSLVGYEVHDVGLTIGYFSYAAYPFTGALVPILPNYPIFLFIFTLIVNLYFVYRVNHSKSW
jgi:hypothetical protein